MIGKLGCDWEQQDTVGAVRGSLSTLTGLLFVLHLYDAVAIVRKVEVAVGVEAVFSLGRGERGILCKIVRYPREIIKLRT